MESKKTENSSSSPMDSKKEELASVSGNYLSKLLILVSADGLK